MTPPGTNHRWLCILLLTTLAVGIGLRRAADAQMPAGQYTPGEVLPIPPPQREPITEVDYRKVPPLAAR